MVAKIKTGRSISGAINYNEHKVRQGKAELISAQGYLKDPVNLTFNDKLQRLTDLTNRNERTLVNTLHVSLNFAVSENLEQGVLQQIADDYMDGLGFGKQPYLVYQHHDAGHPHLHIVTTNIEPDGKRISFHLLANRASESSRKQVELNYNLVKAEEQGKQQNVISRPLEQVNYGKSELKRSITNVVNEVVKAYKFTSIPELNAVLNQYNITADRGSKDSRMYEKNGLVYWILDEKGNKLGVPIKASSIYGKPTLKALEDRFRLNEVLRKPLNEQLKSKVDKALATPISKMTFQKKLKEDGIQVIFRQNEEGRLYGITFVDHGSKSVFNGSDLGKNYSAATLINWFKKDEVNHNQTVSKKENNIAQAPKNTDNISASNTAGSNGDSLLNILFKEEQQDMAAIGRLQQNKRKKKRKGHSL
ncbi:relaxase/mobilization nuclease domain-containing protein [Mucilaginibacter gossypii]|uniref:Relaxase/Mobilisation nuclease domain-containing protein n=1 Tax=Mucilaginibacter gossypii TaxID=551996 RepID=A0A1G7RIT4_9SPHI|nr:relaxase/mobilization nuclease domain-containing protein [Mucilaginibacter gossypii]SDG10642.1 Relaxase/Mobilisation nuclease domain-containing protein [Mucilaginibacter gossypii]